MLYFDHASTTKISEQSLNAYNFASNYFFNPSSLYAPALETKKLLDSAREYVLSFLKAKPNSTVIFTGSASESNNAVLSAHIQRKDKKYIFSAGEHSSVYFCAKNYQEKGYNVVFVPLNKNGSVDLDKLYSELDESVALVSVVMVSNETGAVNDIQAITKKVKTICPNAVVHTDAVQAVGKIAVNVKTLGVDYLTLSAHKIHGPKGVGALYIANPNKFKPFIWGGGQENGLRASTENIAGIHAFKVALENVSKIDYSQHKKIILDNLKGDFTLVSDTNCVNNIISLCFKGVRGETIEHILEEQGFLIGTGSACNSKAGVNRVLQPIVDKDYIEGAVRISFGEEVSLEDCKNLATALSNAVNTYRERIKK